MKLIAHLKTLIVRQDYKEVFKIIKTHLKENSSVHDDLLIIESNVKRNKDDFNKGVISYEEFTLFRSRITVSLFDFINSIENNLTTDTIEQNEQSQEEIINYIEQLINQMTEGFSGAINFLLEIILQSRLAWYSAEKQNSLFQLKYLSKELELGKYTEPEEFKLIEDDYQLVQKIEKEFDEGTDEKAGLREIQLTASIRERFEKLDIMLKFAILKELIMFHNNWTSELEYLRMKQDDLKSDKEILANQLKMTQCDFTKIDVLLFLLDKKLNEKKYSTEQSAKRQ